YYLVVGWPLAVLPTMTGVLLTRLLSAALCAALLASALATSWPQPANGPLRRGPTRGGLRRRGSMHSGSMHSGPTRRGLMPLTVLFCVSPMVSSLNGLVNPDGIAIDAAILLWVALLRLLNRDPESRPDLENPADGRIAGRAGVAA